MEESLRDTKLPEKEEKEQDIRAYSPLTLAYMGDAVFEIMIRTRIVKKANAPVNKLNKKASELAKAPTQAIMVEGLMAHFTEEELSVYKRGRNAHSYTKAKNASTGDYRKATGLEAVFGYLYLKGELNRVEELFDLALETYKKYRENGA